MVRNREPGSCYSLEWARTHVVASNRYSEGNRHDPKEWLCELSKPGPSDKVCTVLKGFLYWLCDRRRRRDGQRYRAVRHTSTLRKIIKYWCMAVKLEVGRRLEKDTVEALHTV